MKIITGDCIDVMRGYPDNHFSAIVTDPPYGLGFMNKAWDAGLPHADIWAEALRVTKPGGYLLSFGGTRTFHRLTCAVEDAGWEIRDCLSWLYGSGFPKSLNISKAIDKANGCEREILGIDPNIHSRGDSTSFPKRPTERTCEESGRVTPQTANRAYLSAPSCDLAKQFNGFGTALKPAWEPIIMAMKPCEGTFAQNAEKWGQAGINIDGSRIECDSRPPRIGENGKRIGTLFEGGFGGSKAIGETNKGRWPANLLLDEEAAAMLDEQRGLLLGAGNKVGSQRSKKAEGFIPGPSLNNKYDNGGGASRFFYCAKASSAERNAGYEELPVKVAFDNESGAMGANMGSKSTARQNNHPTVKPLKLMEYLIKLVMPPANGLLLDPFLGSGTTLLAAKNLGFDGIGIEKLEEYATIARVRVGCE